MAIPSCFDTDFLRVSLVGITDVQTIINELVDNLTVDLPVASRWTSLGGGAYRSPIQDPGGANRFMTLTVGRTSATRISWLVQDQGGNTVQNGLFDIVAPASAVIWTGPYHAAVETQFSGTTYEFGWAFMVDPSPFGLGSNDVYVMGKTRRASSGTAYSTQTPQLAAMNDQGGASAMAGRIMLFNLSSASITWNPITTAGSVPVMPAEVATSFSTTVRRWAGRAYQMIALPSQITPYTEVDVPLDSGVIGTFEVIGGSGSFSAVSNGTVAFRKA